MTTLNFPRPMSVQIAEYERDGHRPLMGDEADALRYLDTVTVLDTEMGDFSTGRVIGCTGEEVKVQSRSGCIMAFDLDNPDFWGDDEVRDRKPPIAVEDGREFVIVTDKPPMAQAEPPKVDVFNALKASLLLTKLQRQLAEAERKHAALLADFTTLQSRVDALEAITPRAVA